MEGLIPLATNDNNGLMSANDKKVYPFFSSSINLIQVTNELLPNTYKRDVVRITGIFGDDTSNVIDAILWITISPYYEAHRLTVKFLTGNRTALFKVFKKDNCFYLELGDKSKPFSGIVMSISIVKLLETTHDDTYTEVTPTILT